MKKFNVPQMNVLKLDTTDIIATSVTIPKNNGGTTVSNPGSILDKQDGVVGDANKPF